MANSRLSKYTLFLPLLFFTLILPTMLHSQGGSGAVFLQLLQSAKQQAMAGAGAFDDLYSIYSNPAATGFLREWQWQATYSKWFAGVKNVSLLHGRKLTTPWSEQTKIAFGIAYQGVQAFNSTEDPVRQTYANDLLLTASFGQPLSFESNRLSFGTNIKLLQSTLGNFDAQSWMADFGLLLRTARFRLLGAKNGIFDEGIFSFGLALTHWGQALHFKNEKTPLPTTLRAGISFHAGVHNGLQLNVLADYRTVYGGSDAFGIGTELSVKESFALRTGYQLDSDLLSHISFGASISLDRNKSLLSNFMPQQNTALRLDFAATPSTAFFDNTFRGGVSYYPVDPESFRFLAPLFGAVLDTDVIQLRWQHTIDPDLFDAVGYRLMVARDSVTIAQALQLVLENPSRIFHPEDSLRLLVDVHTEKTSYTFPPKEEGAYFWAVLAYDKDRHVRPAHCKNGLIARFFLAAPDIEITSFDFQYSPIIRNDDYQGTLNLVLANNSTRFAKDFTLTVSMEKKNSPFISFPQTATVDSTDLLFKQRIVVLAAKGEKQIVLPWHTKTPGEYRIVTRVAHNRRGIEIDTLNNVRELEAYTIPRGVLQTADTAYVRLVMTYLFDLPFISEVYFDRNNARLRPEYLSNGVLDPSLQRLARRLRAHPNVTVRIRGFSDPNSGETRANLADQRAISVKNALMAFGVYENQIELLSGKVLLRRKMPGNTHDAEWLAAERRSVKISTSVHEQKILFGATAHADSEIVEAPVTVVADINTAVPLIESVATFRTQNLIDSISVNKTIKGYGIYGDFDWPQRKNSLIQAAELLGQYVTFSLNIADSLGRRFFVPPDSFYVDLYADDYDQKVIWPLKFGETSPMYDFYWERLYAFVDRLLKEESMRLRFIGHACAIGPKIFNQGLSERRANTFKNKFLRYVKSSHPEAFKKISRRLDESIGYGETRPLRVKHTFCELDVQHTNHSPYERKLNRRIEIGFYRTSKAKELFGTGFELTSKADVK